MAVRGKAPRRGVGLPSVMPSYKSDGAPGEKALGLVSEMVLFLHTHGETFVHEEALVAQFFGLSHALLEETFRFVMHFVADQVFLNVHLAVRSNETCFALLDKTVRIVESLISIHTVQKTPRNLPLTVLATELLLRALVSLDASLQSHYNTEEHALTPKDIPQSRSYANTTSKSSKSSKHSLTGLLKSARTFATYSPPTETTRIASDVYVKGATQDNVVSIVDLNTVFSSLLALLKDFSTNAKQTIQHAHSVVGNKGALLQPLHRYAKEIESYRERTHAAVVLYLTGWLTRPDDFTHAFMWIPFLHQLTIEDFMTSLLLGSLENTKHFTPTSQLIQRWAKTPNAMAGNGYLASLFNIYRHVVVFHTHTSLMSVMDVTGVPVTPLRIYRIPLKYFFLNLHPRFVAQKLTEVHVNIFTRCQPRAIFYSKQMELAGLKATDLKKKVDILANWVSQALYETLETPALFQDLHVFFYGVICTLFHLRHNLLATLGMALGFVSHRFIGVKLPPLRADLHETKEWVDVLIRPCDGSYKNLIAAMKQLGNPCIPYFGSFQNIFEKAFSSTNSNVKEMYMNIGRATEETRRNRIKWSDVAFEDSTSVDLAYGVSFEGYLDTPPSDSLFFDSRYRTTTLRAMTFPARLLQKHCQTLHLHRTRSGFFLKTVSVCRYPRRVCITPPH